MGHADTDCQTQLEAFVEIAADFDLRSSAFRCFLGVVYRGATKQDDEFFIFLARLRQELHSAVDA